MKIKDYKDGNQTGWTIIPYTALEYNFMHILIQMLKSRDNAVRANLGSNRSLENELDSPDSQPSQEGSQS